jgi:hypothetical protein
MSEDAIICCSRCTKPASVQEARLVTFDKFPFQGFLSSSFFSPPFCYLIPGTWSTFFTKPCNIQFVFLLNFFLLNFYVLIFRFFSYHKGFSPLFISRGAAIFSRASTLLPEPRTNQLFLFCTSSSYTIFAFFSRKVLSLLST